jgi:hypothetical protein
MVNVIQQGQTVQDTNVNIDRNTFENHCSSYHMSYPSSPSSSSVSSNQSVNSNQSSTVGSTDGSGNSTSAFDVKAFINDNMDLLIVLGSILAIMGLIAIIRKVRQNTDGSIPTGRGSENE